MGAYYHFDGPNCLVKTSVLRGSGSAMWCPDAPSGSIHYHVEKWNQLFPGYKVPVPSFCRTQQPGGDNPIWKPGESGQAPTSGNPPIWGKDTPKSPITGPEPEEPQPGCGPAMSVPEDDRTTSSQFSRTGSASSSGDYGSGVIDQLGQPLVVGMTPLATYTSTGKPNFTQATEIDIRDQYQGKAIHSLHEGTGNGILCFHPPELQDYMLHGSGVNPDSRWPTNISEVTVLLHNCGRADSSTGDSTVTRLAFGNPLSGTVKPKSGVYFEYDPSTGTLAIQHTDSSGADDSNGDITWNGTSLVGAGSGDISSGSNLTSGRVVKATGNKQIDTPVDLSMQYITVDAADDTVQLLAGPSKRIEIRSPDKIYFDVNGTNEMIVESGKVTIPDSGNIAAPNLRNTLHFPPGQQVANLTSTRQIADVTHFVYLGRARAAVTTVTVHYRVTTAAVTITAAEVGVATGTPVLGGNASLTRVGYADVSAVVNSTGIKSTAVTVSGVAAGDHLWAAFYCSAETTLVVRGCLADDLQTGQYQTLGSQLSAMSGATATTLYGATDVPPWLAVEW